MPTLTKPVKVALAIIVFATALWSGFIVAQSPRVRATADAAITPAARDGVDPATRCGGCGPAPARLGPTSGCCGAAPTAVTAAAAAPPTDKDIVPIPRNRGCGCAPTPEETP